MKLIFENWRGFLDEKLMLKPGPSGWDLYAEIVAEAYLAAPVYEERAVKSFEALVPFIDKMYKQIQSRIDIEPVDYHPYDVGLDVDVTGVDRMRQSVEDTGILQVSTADPEHPVFDNETNMKFRAVHDYMTHIQPKKPAGFTSSKEKGSIHQELRAYNIHAKTVPRDGIPALFTEVVGQVCTFYVTGRFQEQKVCILDGFDYINVGVVDGYDIVSKQLVKKESSRRPENS
jgi:hypothetical protein